MKKHTKKYVLTGGAGIGKTTLLELLSAQGFEVVPEAARFIIEAQLAIDGDALPWKDNPKFQEMVADRQITLESKLTAEVAFLDRGLVDGDGYCAHFGIATPAKIGEYGKDRYEKVFILDRLPEYKNDVVRRENDEEMAMIHQAVIDAYLRFGYDPVFVPVLPPKERIAFILARM